MEKPQLHIRFQSHAGSIEAAVGREDLCPRLGGFQSHAGSIEALSGRARPAGEDLVSIPRWFD